MSRLFAAVLVLLLWPATAATADSGISADPGVNEFLFRGNQSAEGSHSDITPSQKAVRHTGNSATHDAYEIQCRLGGDQTCDEPQLCENGSVMIRHWSVDESGGVVPGSAWYDCPAASSPTATPPPGPTPDQIYTAFKSIPLPASDLHVQPADGRTLVHFKTNFYTDGRPLDRPFDLSVGPPSQQVTYHLDFRITPTFTFDFGDDTTATTTHGGRPFPALEVTHEYLHAAALTASVSTTYAADYRIGSGPWTPVDGTVTMTGATASVTVLEAAPVLTD